MSHYKSEEIYKMDTKGKIRVWKVEAIDGQWRTVAGVQDGNLVTSAWTKSVAKSQPTGQLQAVFEALDREYYRSIEDAATGVPKMFLVSRPVNLAEVDEEKIPFPCEAQPKLDGFRCHIDVTGAYTRENKPYFSVNHVLKALEPFFEAYPTARLDGELYGHEMAGRLQEISSMLRKQTPTPEQDAECERLIQMHIFDTPLPGKTTTDRLSEYRAWFEANQTPHIEFVETVIVQSMAELYLYHEKNLGRKMEGTILRIDAEYTPKKTKNVLKIKDFTCAEYPILRIEEGIGNWEGCAKRIIYDFGNGEEFGTGVRGSKAEMTKLFNERDEWVGNGSEGTVRFFGLTDSGRPNLAVTVNLHKGGRKD